MGMDTDRHDPILDRWKRYQALFGQLNDSLHTDIKYSNKWPKHFQSVLDLLMLVFGGRVVYTYHEIVQNKTKLRFGGPDNYIASRQGDDITAIDKGLIGSTLKDKNCLFKIFDDVSQVDEYLEARKETESELVIKIFNSSHSNVTSVLNLESANKSDFNYLDGLVFALIAAWQESFRIEEDFKEQKFYMIKKVSDVFQAVGGGYPQRS